MWHAAHKRLLSSLCLQKSTNIPPPNIIPEKQAKFTYTSYAIYKFSYLHSASSQPKLVRLFGGAHSQPCHIQKSTHQPDAQKGPEPTVHRHPPLTVVITDSIQRYSARLLHSRRWVDGSWGLSPSTSRESPTEKYLHFVCWLRGSGSWLLTPPPNGVDATYDACNLRRPLPPKGTQCFSP